jgi:hypothetical protein
MAKAQTTKPMSVLISTEPVAFKLAALERMTAKAAVKPLLHRLLCAETAVFRYR